MLFREYRERLPSDGAGFGEAFEVGVGQTDLAIHILVVSREIRCECALTRSVSENLVALEAGDRDDGEDAARDRDAVEKRRHGGVALSPTEINGE